MKAALNIARPLCACVLLLLALLLGGCTQMFQWLYLASYDRDISSATRAVETASDDAHRAAAYTKRGSAYSEKARYSRVSELISADEYSRLFGLAIKDHDQAVALDPASAEAYYWRGQTYYDRAALEVVVNGHLVGTDAGRKAWFAPRSRRFKESHREGRPALSSMGYARLEPRDDRRTRRGGQRVRARVGAESKIGQAALGRRLLRAGGRSPKREEGCRHCGLREINRHRRRRRRLLVRNPLFGLYTQDRQYDQAWGVVHKARSSKKWIEPELLDRLKKESGRSN